MLIEMTPEDKTLRNMACLLSDTDRLKLFEDLCQILGEPIPERVWLSTRIRKTDVYRYLPKSRSLRGGRVPSPATTVRIIRALIKGGQAGIQSAINALDRAEAEMRTSYRQYFFWKKALRESNRIYDPLSRVEIDKLERSL
jgi:hypothetical protein